MSGGNFRDTDEFEKGWNCRFTGSKKDKNLVNLTADDKSFIIGYYQGSREFKKDNKTYIVHKIHAMKIGNPAHSPAIENPKGEIREFFGTTVINKKLHEKAQPGQMVKILWLGKNANPKGGGDPYDDWKLLIDDSEAPFLANGTSEPDATASAEMPVENGAAKDAKKSDTPKEEKKEQSAGEDDDDLPF